MKKHKNNIPAGSKLNRLRRICNLIPELPAARIARASKVT